MTGRKADLIDHLGAVEPSNSRKRCAAFRESEDERVGDGDSLDGFERMENPKRHRRLPQTQQIQTLDDDPTDSYGGTASREPLPPVRRASPIRRYTISIDSGKLNKKSKRYHLCSEEPSTDSANFGSFQMPYPDGLTPPLTSEPERNRFSEEVLIISDGSDAGDEQRSRKPTTTSLGTSTEKDKRSVAKTPRGFEDVKTEPLTDAMMKRTMFLVTIHGSPIGPVPVPFTDCGNFHTFFPRLIEERGVPNEDAREINDITTIFSWTGGEYGGRVGGIRKNMPGDWVYFCDSLRKAHAMDANRFKGKCEVAIKLHISDGHKEHC